MKPAAIKIYDGDTLIHDYTLCEDPQGRIGWYDTICEEFHDQTEQLRSALLKKPEGTQYIDTGAYDLREQEERSKGCEHCRSEINRGLMLAHGYSCCTDCGRRLEEA